MASSSSVVRPIPTGPQLFICFHGKDVRKNFISFLVPALRDANINVFTEEDELLGSDLGNLLKRIEESEIALVIFSVDFTSSYWCLDQLAKIKERKDQDRLKVIPIFYKVQRFVVKYLRSTFGDNFRDLRRSFLHQPQRILNWEEALVTISETIGMPLAKQSDTSDKDFITNLVIKIQILLEDMAKKRNQEREVIRQGGTIVSVRTPEKETEVPSSSNPAREPETEATHQGPSVVHLMLRAGEMEINSSEDPLKWVWSTINEPPNSEETEIVTMINIHWVQIAGKITTDNLTPGTTYEAVFVVKIEDNARGWRRKPVTLKLKVVQYDGNNNQVDRIEYLNDYKGHNWVDILAGVFVVPPKSTPATIKFAMNQYDSVNYRKCGLVVKGVAIRPKDL